MQRELRPGAVPRLVRLLGRAIGGEAALLDSAGKPVADALDGDLLDELGEAIERVATGRAQSAATGAGALSVEIQSIGETSPHAVLVVARERPFTAAARSFLVGAGRLLWLGWRLDSLAQAERRLGEAERHVRQAVLQLLMSGEVSAARRTAGAMTPALPDHVRVYIVESTGDRERLAAEADEACGRRAWIVRCPVYRAHLIVLAQAAAPHDDRVQTSLRGLASTRSDTRVGISHGVGLPETPVGYQQAMHALAAARGSAQRAALFDPRAELAEVLDSQAPPWAVRQLRPLLEYVPQRHGDPDAEELVTTLELWLGFGPGAANLLSIHRNTLTGRLARIKGLLGRDLNPIGTRASLGLAVRLLRLRLARHAVTPADAMTDADLDTLLLSPKGWRWADLQLAPLEQADDARLLATVRCWLEHDTRTEATAQALGISVPAVRKRLARVEQVLQRSLLTGPSTAGELWLALRSQQLRSARLV